MAGTLYTVLSNTFFVKDGNRFVEEISNFPFYNEFEVIQDKENPARISIFYWGSNFKGIIPYNPNAESYYSDIHYKSKEQNIEMFGDFISDHLCKGEIFRVVSCSHRIALFCEYEEFIVYNGEHHYFHSGLYLTEPKIQSLKNFISSKGGNLETFRETDFLKKPN